MCEGTVRRVARCLAGGSFVWADGFLVCGGRFVVLRVALCVGERFVVWWMALCMASGSLHGGGSCVAGDSLRRRGTSLCGWAASLRRDGSCAAGGSLRGRRFVVLRVALCVGGRFVVLRVAFCVRVVPCAEGGSLCAEGGSLCCGVVRRVVGGSVCGERFSCVVGGSLSGWWFSAVVGVSRAVVVLLHGRRVVRPAVLCGGRFVAWRAAPSPVGGFLR